MKSPEEISRELSRLNYIFEGLRDNPHCLATMTDNFTDTGEPRINNLYFTHDELVKTITDGSWYCNRWCLVEKVRLIELIKKEIIRLTDILAKI